MDGINYLPGLDFLLAPQPQANIRRGEVDVLLANRAGFWVRLRAWSLDKLMVMLMTASTLSVTDMVLDFLGIPYLADQAIHILLMICLVIVIDAAYYIIFHASSGQTIGKMILNIRVVSDTGKPMSYGQALKRWLGSLASGFFLGMGYLKVAFSRNKLAWHDIIARTIVVRP